MEACRPLVLPDAISKQWNIGGGAHPDCLLLAK
jgi:hypothetical protein